MDMFFEEDLNFLSFEHCDDPTSDSKIIDAKMGRVQQLDIWVQIGSDDGSDMYRALFIPMSALEFQDIGFVSKAFILQEHEVLDIPKFLERLRRQVITISKDRDVSIKTTLRSLFFWEFEEKTPVIGHKSRSFCGLSPV